MRKGFTTGSCAAAAAKAAAWMLLTGQEKEEIRIMTPAGTGYRPKITDRYISGEYAECGVVKDGGDDPDVTTGLHIMARVERIKETDGPRVLICGGEGVGTVTEPGLDQPVGEAAINHVPREMIIREVTEVLELLDEPGMLKVTIHVPGGREVAEKTFNPRMGITGGISIIGTSGIVEPMSEKALTDTIRLELRQRHCKGQETAIVTPGNYGLEMLKKVYGYDLDRAVKCSNFIGDTIEMAAEEGFRRMVLMGHMGKLVKCAGGAMNTHSKYGDHRMEILADAAAELGFPAETTEKIKNCVSTEAALKTVLPEEARSISSEIRKRALVHLRKKAADRIGIELILYTNEMGILADSEEAVSWLMDEMS